MLILALGAEAHATTISVTSASREVSLEIVETSSGGAPTNGGVGPLSSSSVATGAFFADFPTGYLTGDGNTVTANAYQDSFVGDSVVSYDGDTSLTIDDAVPPGTANGIDVYSSSTMEVFFSLSSAEPFDLVFAWSDSCDWPGCVVFELENVDTASTIFEGQGTVFNGEDVYGGGTFSGTLAAGNYRFYAGSFATWHIASREFPGAPLTLTLTIPEPSTAPLFTLGLFGLALRQRRLSRCGPR